ncbi:hypothetical protein V502_06507 [Pseudogymnoascus sp. VKM F-4520 (FW-2644)]|nr:hypothetical protein V502_06507 [Pseudogymnoascus sp. VKM F-4520 (FW-2644)]
MDPMDPASSFTAAQLEALQQMFLNPPGEPRPRTTRRRRSPSPGTDRPRRNLRPRLTQPSYVLTGPKDDDSDSNSPEDAPLTTTQPDKNTINQPTITSDTASPHAGPLPISQTNGNTSDKNHTTSGPAPAPDASPMASQIKTETKPDIDSEAEDDRELLSVEAEIRSKEAKRALLKTRKRNREARKMTSELAVSMADTKEREDALMVLLVGADTVSKEELDELREIKERYDDSIRESEMKIGELAERRQRRQRLEEFIDFIEKKVQRRKKVPNGEGEAKLVEENHRDDGESGEKSGDGGDGDQGDEDEFDGFIVYDSDDYDYDDGDGDEGYHEDGDER